jgi:hypothetical protein
MTTPRTLWSIILLLFCFVAQEFWQIWRDSDLEVDWFLASNYKTSIQWYYKDMGRDIERVIVAYVIYRITFKIPSLRAASIVYLLYAIAILCLFFYNYNRASYAIVFSTIGVVAMIAFNWKVFIKSIRIFLNLEEAQKHTINKL